MCAESKIINFFEGKTIFVTGATGLLGKALVYKLLSACNGLEAIYVLIRVKRDKDVQKRFEELLRDDVFDKIRKNYPKFSNKIMPLVGDISQPHLGLKEQDWNTLIQNVSVIFHVAATVNFTEKLNDAIQLNVRSTEEVKNLVLQCSNLESVLFVGTAYSQFLTEEVIEEKFYEPPITAAEAIGIGENVSGKALEQITPRLLQNIPNTYIYTKAIAEEIVGSLSSSIPCCLLRPSIISAAVEEPLQGWISRGGALTLITTAIAKGFLKVVPTKAQINADLVPVDYVANAMIACAYKTAMEGKNTKVRVYNYVTHPQNPVTWKVWQDAHVALKAYKNTKRNRFITTGNRFYFRFLLIFLHTIPAVIKDFFNILFLKKPKFVQMAIFFNTSMQIISPFGWNALKAENKNIQQLWNEMSKVDKELFPFDMATIEWSRVLEMHIHGIVRHLLKWK